MTHAKSKCRACWWAANYWWAWLIVPALVIYDLWRDDWSNEYEHWEQER